MTEVSLTPESTKALAMDIIKYSSGFGRTESEKKLRNVKILLENYRYLQNHLDIELPEIQMDDKLSGYQLSLYSLLGYRARSREMMEFVNDIFNQYKHICQSGTEADRRKYSIIDGLYLSEKHQSKQSLCERWNIDGSTLNRDEHKAMNELKVMLFGIDSLNDITK